MTTPLTLQFRNEPDALREAIQMAGRSLLARGQRVVLNLLGFVTGCVVALGAVALVIILLGAIQQPERMLTASVLGLACGIAFSWAAFGLPFRYMAQASATSAFASGTQTFIADADGFTLENAKARWRTAWSATEMIALGRKGIALRVSGIAVSLPLSTFGDRAEMVAFLEGLSDLKSGAT